LSFHRRLKTKVLLINQLKKYNNTFKKRYSIQPKRLNASKNQKPYLLIVKPQLLKQKRLLKRNSHLHRSDYLATKISIHKRYNTFQFKYNRKSMLKNHFHLKDYTSKLKQFQNSTLYIKQVGKKKIKKHTQ
jgi:hypothetical protein